MVSDRSPETEAGRRGGREEGHGGAPVQEKRGSLYPETQTLKLDKSAGKHGCLGFSEGGVGG